LRLGESLGCHVSFNWRLDVWKFKLSSAEAQAGRSMVEPSNVLSVDALTWNFFLEDVLGTLTKWLMQTLKTFLFCYCFLLKG
jgi:hypothetical protein